MKTKLAIAFLIVGFLVAYCVLGIDYMKQNSVHEKMTSEIANTAQELKQIPKPPQELEQRLAAAQASLTAIQSAFPGQPNTTQLINKILKLADECQVAAIPISTKEWSSEKTGKGYLVFRLNMTVSGDFSQFVNFVSRLENGEFETIVIENINVSRAVQPSGEKAVSDNRTAPVTADLDVAIYARATASNSD